MKNADSKVVFWALLLLLLVQATALAEGNTQTVGVSCVIPAIPGVNAPPSEKQLIKERAVLKEMDMPARQDNQQEPSSIIAEDTQESKTTGQEGDSVLVLVKTIYNR